MQPLLLAVQVTPHARRACVALQDLRHVSIRYRRTAVSCNTSRQQHLQPGGTSLHVVGVRHEEGLRAALLPRARVRILVALVGHVVQVAHVRAQYLPVKARIFQEHLRV